MTEFFTYLVMGVGLFLLCIVLTGASSAFDKSDSIQDKASAYGKIVVPIVGGVILILLLLYTGLPL